MSHVDVKNLKLSKFEEEHYDEYDCYNLTDKYAGEETGFLLLQNFTRDKLTVYPVLVLQRVRPAKAEPRRRLSQAFTFLTPAGVQVLTFLSTCTRVLAQTTAVQLG
ncbi:hypothetical protein XENOCAPTIV_002732 [Xenoophorus captivus]|uniref:Uncharacterized protein n=1 Tax=Xenoophorus captivus TaxID=1517983 RepID=A0ABV0RFG2_9TELE